MTENAVRASVTVRAPVEQVYAAFTDGPTLSRWWGAWAGCDIIDATLDARQGGSYSIQSRTRRGESYGIRGEFLHLEAGTMIVATWKTSDSSSFASVVQIRLAPKGEASTEVQVRHADLIVQIEWDRMQSAWRRILQVLERGVPRMNGGLPPEFQDVAPGRQPAPARQASTKRRS